ncbi:phasin family protein [Methylobacterium sp. WSM2598]|uniref:phasin family protein n=1 Tax=Methylobacterium sp. WSM2598 TaxID=398261 RepID=UPI0003A176A3|nr:phasin family protein [Methylobacterium sp. WSM2598]
MTFNPNTAPNKQAEPNERIAEAVRATIKETSEQRTQFADAIRDGMSKTADLGEKSAQSAEQGLQKNVEAASQQACEAADHFTRTLGFTGQDGERLARQSKQNLEVVMRCGTVLTQAIQDASRGWFELGQKQWRRNLDGLTKLTRATSVQEFTAIQSELVREGLQHMVQDSKAIAEGSVRAVEEASKAFSGVAQQSPTLPR